MYVPVELPTRTCPYVGIVGVPVPPPVGNRTVAPKTILVVTNIPVIRCISYIFNSDNHTIIILLPVGPV